VFWFGIDNIGCLVRSSRTMRAVTCTDSGCAFARCTLYTVALTGCVPADLVSGVDEVELRKAGLPRRETGRPFGDVSIGAAAKNEDLRWARLWLEESRDPRGETGGDNSRLDFSASALILCEMPEETLTFLATPTASKFT
jgi:hypothetical protein